MTHKRRSYSKKDPMGMNNAYRLMDTAIKTTAGIAITNAAIGAARSFRT